MAKDDITRKVIVVDDETHRQVRIQAAEQGISLGELVKQLLEMKKQQEKQTKRK
jgi:predicted HicB family RNase H-like nuclease